MTVAPDSQDVVVVGMSCRFPGADTPDAFWDNVASGVESRTVLSAEELLATGAPDADDPRFVPVGYFVDGVADFDADYFGIDPAQARATDPQHRLFLECVDAALHDAGYAGPSRSKSTGLFAGSPYGTYGPQHAAHDAESNRLFDRFGLHLLNDPDSLTGAVSYRLGLGGPSMTIGTACSTSLVAVHLARQSLLAGECDLAIAGGVDVESPLRHGYRHSGGAGMFSVSGRCRPFDHRADGTIFGSGAGAVVMRRAADAFASGDHIYAVVRGSATNNDGSDRFSFRAPSVDRQAAVISTVLRATGLSASTVGYVECQGAGTPVGDLVEVEALTTAFRASGAGGAGVCALGSVKANIGHLGRAAGIAGFIKAVLAVYHGQIPPTVNFEEANPDLDLDNTPFHVPTVLSPWPTTSSPRRAAVNSFGLGGTNAHVLVQEAPARAAARVGRPWLLVPLSARTPDGLRIAAAALDRHLASHPELALADVAHTLQVGRAAHPYRRAIVVSANRDRDPAAVPQSGAEIVGHAAPSHRHTVAFLFPPDGDMLDQPGRELYEHEPVFRDAIDRCGETVEPHPGTSMRDLLYPDQRSGGVLVREPRLAQLARFAVQYATARLWQSWGVRVDLVLGVGTGDYAAAVVAGWLPLAEGAARIAGRAVPSEPGQESPPHRGRLHVVSPALGRRLTQNDFTELPIGQERPPRLAEALRVVLDAATVVVDMGASGELLRQARRAGDTTTGSGRAVPTMLTSLCPGADLRQMLAGLGELWVSGLQPAWAGLVAGERPSKVPLPGYPYERKRYWIDPSPSAVARKAW